METSCISEDHGGPQPDMTQFYTLASHSDEEDDVESCDFFPEMLLVESDLEYSPEQLPVPVEGEPQFPSEAYIDECGDAGMQIEPEQGHEPEGVDAVEEEGEPEPEGRRMYEHLAHGHFPYWSACPTCRKTRGTSPGRRQKADDGWSVGMDFAFFGKVRFLILLALSTGMLMCVPWKEAEDVNTSLVCQAFLEIGATGQRVEVVSDQEALIKSAILKASRAPTWCPKSLHFRPARTQTKGAIERAVRTWKEGVRVNTLFFEEQVKQRIAFESDLFMHVTQYTCRVYNRFHVGVGLRSTPLDRLRGVCGGKTPSSCPFGCTVYVEVGRQSSHDHARFLEGAYLGPCLTQGGGHLGAVQSEVYRGRTVKVQLPLVFDVTHVGDMLGEAPLPSIREPGFVGEDVEDVVVRDYWEFDLDMGTWARRHLRPRRCLFVPVGLRDCPFDPDVALGQRVTEYRFPEQDLQQFEDDWRTSRNPQLDLGGAWAGSTYFFFPKGVSGQAGAVDVGGFSLSDLSPSDVWKQGPSTDAVKHYGGSRGCPSCSSGMSAPGIRHTAKCKRRFADLIEGELQRHFPKQGSSGLGSAEAHAAPSRPDPPSSLPEPRKRLREDSFEEKPVEGPGQDFCGEPPACPGSFGAGKRALLDPSEDRASKIPRTLDVVWFDECEKQVDAAMRLSPIFRGDRQVRVPWKLGGQLEVQMSKGAQCDLTGESLPPTEVDEGILTEVKALSQLEVGDLMPEKDARSGAHRNGVKLIPTRWVVSHKAPGLVRCRLVCHDFRDGQSAISLGLYSPTGTVDVLRLFLAVVSAFGLHMTTVDISTAFLFAKVKGVAYVLCPPGITYRGERCALKLRKALYGLRSAPLSWYRTILEFFASFKIHPCGADPTVLQGCLTLGSQVFRVLVMLYVDDLLLASSSRSAIEHLVSRMSERFKVKVTGALDALQVGALQFLGRKIWREVVSGPLLFGVSEEFEKKLMSHEFLAGLKPTKVPPNLRPLQDLPVEDRAPLTAEGSSRYRSVLGLLAWLSQARGDLCYYVSVLSSFQSAPCQQAETGLRNLCRFVVGTSPCRQRMPSRETHQDWVLDVFVDASWSVASYSGGVLMAFGTVIKTFFRKQASVALSSAEAELVAICEGLREAEGVSVILQELLGVSFANEDQKSLVDICLHTDSMAAVYSAQMEGVLRRMRHVQLRLRYVQQKLKNGVASICWVAGAQNPADLLTKPLGFAHFFVLADKLGFESVLERREKGSAISISGFVLGSRNFLSGEDILCWLVKSRKRVTFCPDVSVHLAIDDLTYSHGASEGRFVDTWKRLEAVVQLG